MTASHRFCALGLRFSLLVFIGGCAAMASTQVGPRSPGKWVAGQFAQVNVGCMMAYICTPGVALLRAPDQVVRTTPGESSFGVCNAGGGAADGCNSCSASPPTKPCEYWLEKNR